jgi:hypothetical protein
MGIKISFPAYHDSFHSWLFYLKEIYTVGFIGFQAQDMVKIENLKMVAGLLFGNPFSYYLDFGQ